VYFVSFEIPDTDWIPLISHFGLHLKNLSRQFIADPFRGEVICEHLSPMVFDGHMVNQVRCVCLLSRHPSPKNWPDSRLLSMFGEKRNLNPPALNEINSVGTIILRKDDGLFRNIESLPAANQRQKFMGIFVRRKSGGGEWHGDSRDMAGAQHSLSPIVAKGGGDRGTTVKVVFGSGLIAGLHSILVLPHIGLEAVRKCRTESV
jgi:hypothetical protein